jgi:aryl hydrocarbon receptor nuclear translocator
MFGACLFDLLHPEDVEKVREQLSTAESTSSGRILDLKTGTVKKEGHQCKFSKNVSIKQYALNIFVSSASMRLSMGSRRSFICRMRLGHMSADNMGHGIHLNRVRNRNTLGPSLDGHNYAVVHSTGYIKNWPPTGMLVSELITLDSLKGGGERVFLILQVD